MKRQIVLGLALSALAAPAMGATAPSAVSFAEGAVAGSLTGTAGNPEEGMKVISDRGLGNCVACHVISAMPDVAFQGNVGPTLDGAADRWSEQQLRGIVADAKKTFDGTIMPSFYKNEGYIRPGDAFTGKAAEGELAPLLTAQQIEDVVAYLLTLKE
ncbi:sulfur oxidation c-type cytochrome SoxX [Defluviimonas sp. WL0024]|uniref:Sulfur oxidation c-type cytochrome SoxX n=2 Tax=Albidovulum TaxID=205889 RepID=A0ABT3J3S5_9RHOB|nr:MULTISPECIES: sulfur oxidation c-type cytochrome SoxX [Defluviimonas]MCU9847941.1 sulfur oxidation c-type cytochrome SoxX [Defluviimonas sp. WL0024]MCW3782345.1 sulfur oxidation c-type cytochrome SoxX [Defluviimonas salinarum]